MGRCSVEMRRPGRQPKPLVERLVSRVNKDHASGCWLWAGSRNKRDGYGRIGAGGRGFRQKLLLAHRASYQCHIGPIPDGMKVLHHCDTPACVNPKHLWLGSIADNNADKVAKGRNIVLRVAKNGMSKLTQAAVDTMRRRAVQHGSISAWAREFGVSRRAITFALAEETWK